MFLYHAPHVRSSRSIRRRHAHIIRRLHDGAGEEDRPASLDGRTRLDKSMDTAESALTFGIPAYRIALIAGLFVERVCLEE
jgi:hypothetical protein